MPNPYPVPAPDDNPNDWKSQYSVPAPDDVAEKKSGGGSVLKGWLDRKIEEQKAKQKLPFGKRLLQELGNVAMPAGDFGLLSAINKVVGDGEPTKAADRTPSRRAVDRSMPVRVAPRRSAPRPSWPMGQRLAVSRLMVLRTGTRSTQTPTT